LLFKPEFDVIFRVPINIKSCLSKQNISNSGYKENTQKLRVIKYHCTDTPWHVPTVLYENLLLFRTILIFDIKRGEIMTSGAYCPETINLIANEQRNVKITSTCTFGNKAYGK
jgi:hypothetical protein